MTTKRALLLAFIANGLGGPSFLARLPERQRDLELSDAGLGAVLLGLALGALVASTGVARAVRRHGSRSVTTAAGVAMGATLWLTAAAPSALALFGALVVLGAADAAMDIAMNANGGAHEADTGRSVLHRLHAAWSLGALAGAGIAAAAAAADVALSIHLVAVGVGMAALSLTARPGLVAADPPPAPAPDGAVVRRVPAVLLVLAGATLAAAVLEGTAGDWSAVQVDRLGVDRSLAPLGTAAFMGGMLVGRLLGDRSTDRHGGARVLRRGMSLCAAGLALGVLWDEPLPFLVGVALAGGGLAGFFPLAFSAAARVPGVASGAGAAAVSLGARAGFLIEPPLVGAVAEATELRVSFAVAAAVAVGIAATAGRIAPASSR